MTVPVPPEAVTAAARVLSYDPGDIDARICAQAVLEAAAPLIAAAERDRIRQLAQLHAATSVRCAAGLIGKCPDCSGGNLRKPFADLLGGDQP